jgi:hypothetical protein
MAIKTSGNRRVQASSAIASGVVVIAKPDGSGFILSGDGITANNVFSQQTVTPGSTSVTTSIGSNSVSSVSVTITATVITTAAYSNLPDLAISTSGGYLRVLGTGFQSSSTVYINGILTATTFVSANEVRAQIPAASSGTATLFVSNTQGIGTLYPSGLRYYPYPVWTSTSSFVTSTTSTSIGFTATTAVSYTLSSGSLPGGLSLNSSTGVLLGTLASTTTTPYTFVISASNSYLQATTQTVTLTYNPLPNISYLVVAGGGAGSNNSNFTVALGGGGGAGGLTTGTINSVAFGTVYTITVGGGGAAPTGTGVGASGNPSSISSPSIPTITATGGGGGGSGSPNPGNATSGGSGGGGAGANPNSGFGPTGVTFASATGSPGVYGVAGPQGYPGGGGQTSAPPSVNGGGGGGGAAGAGGIGSTPAAGNGGTAFLWPYTGVYYAGGGGGGGATAWATPATSIGLGGGVGTSSPTSGGGGDGGLGVNGASFATAGTPGRGGGGGGGGNGGGSAAGGGGGVVILAIPTPGYKGSAPGAAVSTPASAPGFTVITFTAPGTYTV